MNSTSTIVYPAAPWSAAQAIGDRATVLEQGAVFLVGVVLPLIVSPWWEFGGSFVTRITAPDIAVLLALVFLAIGRQRLRWDLPTSAYVGSLLFAFLIGLVRSGGAGEMMTAVTAFFALGMAVLYWTLGSVVARSPVLLRALFAGLVVGVMWESVIVLHDLFAAAQWFPDPDVRRVRGTFRANGQLAAYGFTAAGLLLTVGWPIWKSNAARLMTFAAGGMAIMFVFAGSRRSGIAALAGWLLAFLVIGFRHVLKRAYRTILLVTLAAVAVLASYWDQVSTSFVGQRTSSAFQEVAAGESTFQIQYDRAMDNFFEWFPVGTGLGRGFTAVLEDPYAQGGFEIHNGHLAILVEMGLLGLVAFYFMVGKAMRCQWGEIFGPRTRLVRTLVFTFVLAMLAFMIHNRSHRDRGGMLLLGIAASLAWAAPKGAPALLVARRVRRSG